MCVEKNIITGVLKRKCTPFLIAQLSRKGLKHLLEKWKCYTLPLGTFLIPLIFEMRFYEVINASCNHDNDNQHETNN